MCVFGSSRKLGQTEFIFHVDRKIPCLTWNSFSGFILPSNDFHPRKIEERESERNNKEIASEACLVTPSTGPNPRSHHQRERGRSPKLDLNGTAVWAVPPSSPIANHHQSTPPSSPIHKHPRPTSPILNVTFCLLGFVALGHGFRSLEFTCRGSWLLLACRRLWLSIAKVCCCGLNWSFGDVWCCFGGGYKFRWLWIVVGGCKWWVFGCDLFCGSGFGWVWIWDLAVTLSPSNLTLSSS